MLHNIAQEMREDGPPLHLEEMDGNVLQQLIEERQIPKIIQYEIGQNMGVQLRRDFITSYFARM